MSLPAPRSGFRVEEGRIGAGETAVKRIAEHHEQRALVGPAVASLDRVVTRSDLGVENLPKFGAKLIKMLLVDGL